MNIQDLENIASKQNGLLKTKDIEENGIPRSKINKLVEDGLLIRESWGIYSATSEMTDEYAAIQKRSAKIVYSYGTALFLHGMSDRVPSIIDITVPQGYNVKRLKKDNNNLRFHYVKPEVLFIGAESVITPQGSNVLAYNRERCICDIIKRYEKTDKQLFTQALKEYFSSSHSTRDLIKMSRLIGVEAEVRKYMEVL